MRCSELRRSQLPLAMTTQHRLASLTLLVLGTAAVLSSCNIVGPGAGDCLPIFVPSVIVEVRDPATGMPAARGVTGRSEHESGVVTELGVGYDLRLLGMWKYELRGNHTILVRKPGFLTDTVYVYVDGNRCNVEPRTVLVHMVPDARALPQHPVSFIEGPEIAAGYPSSRVQGVQVYGDTLEIKGFALTDCTELRVVAFRSDNGLHVQVEPSDIQLDPCVGPRQFELRYTLPPEPTHLLVTNSSSLPAELFSGQVRQSDAG